MKQNCKNLYVTGGTGFVGSALVREWLGRDGDFEVIIQTRFPDKAPNQNRVRYVQRYAEVDAPVTAVVNLAGAPIADKRWRAQRKSELETSRISLTEALVDDMRANKPDVVVSASAIGFYGLGATEVDESNKAGHGYAAELCERWEKAVKPCAAYTRLVIARLGVVIGRGGMLDKLKPMYTLGLGGPIASGNQWLSWVHIHDVHAGILEVIDDPSYEGAYNFTSPAPVQQKVFAKRFASAMHRPAIVPTPAFVLRLVFGDMAEELLIGGQRVLPKRLQEKGVRFQYSDLVSALEEALKSSR